MENLEGLGLLVIGITFVAYWIQDVVDLVKPIIKVAIAKMDWLNGNSDDAYKVSVLFVKLSMGVIAAFTTGANLLEYVPFNREAPTFGTFMTGMIIGGGAANIHHLLEKMGVKSPLKIAEPSKVETIYEENTDVQSVISKDA